MRRAARTDGNHADIVKALRKIGASVADTSAVGSGFPDLVAGFRGMNWLIEVKNPESRIDKQRLTPLQQEFVAGWRGHWVLVKSAEEAIAAVQS